MTVQPSVTPDKATRQSRRASRIDARYALWSLSSLKRIRACGRFAARTDNGVVVKASGSCSDGSRVAGFSGVQSCGSVWACPVCSATIQARRQAETLAALRRARKRGWEVLMVTLTVRHTESDSLRYVWGEVGKGWRAATSGSRSAWGADRALYGIQGYLRLLEVTHGDNGWHVHVHALLFVDPKQAACDLRDGQLFDDDVWALGWSLFGRFRAAVVAELMPSLRRGLDVRRVRDDDVIADYFAKQIYTRKGESSTAHDVTGAHSKECKNGNRTPFGIVASLVNVHTGELGANYETDLELWHTFEKVSKGKRQLLWSNGLKAELGLNEEEQSDQEIVDEGHGGVDVGTVPAPIYRHVAECGGLESLLRAAESDDRGDVLADVLRLVVWWYRHERLAVDH